MSTQYDTIQAGYDEMRKWALALIEHVNVQQVVAPLIKGASTLDLACDTGFYSYDFLLSGAAKVTGIDMSGVMIEKARSAAASRISTNCGAINFRIADCSKPKVYEDGPFNLVLGAWLLELRIKWQRVE